MALTETPEHVPVPADRAKGREDPWAHRRGEPRLFTLLWTVYLLCATGVSIGAVGLHAAVLEEGARSAARIILVTAAVGMGLLWPMTRLSQLAPARRGVGWAAQDTLAVALPVQAVIWPHIWLANWHPGTALAISALLASWSVLIGALLAIAVESSPGGAGVRALWMVVFVLLVGGVPMADLALKLAGVEPAVDPDRIGMASPLTAIDRITERPAWLGAAPITGEHWMGIGLTAVAACVLWLVALALGRGGRGRGALR